MFLFTKEIGILKISEENFVDTSMTIVVINENINAQKNHVRPLLSFVMKL